MSINVTVSAAGCAVGKVSVDTSSAVAELIREAGPAFADVVGETVTLAFAKGPATGSSTAVYGFGNPEGLLFDVVATGAYGDYLDGMDGVTIRDLATMAETSLDEALSYNDKVVVTISVYKSQSVEETAPLQEWEKELLGLDLDSLDLDLPDEDEDELQEGPVRDSIQASVEILGGVTLNELLDSGVDPIVYGSIVMELRDSL